MTTQTQRTPYDAEIERLGQLPISSKTGDRRSDRLMFLAAQRHMRDGYLAAKAEDSDLLAACELVLSFAEKQPWTGLGDSKGYGVDLPARLRAAISKARREA